MRRTKKTGKKRKFVGFLVILLWIVLLATAGYLIYSIALLSGIENKIRLLLSIDLVIFCFGFLFFLRRSYKNNNKTLIVLIIIGYIMATLFGIVGYYVKKTYNIVDNMTVESTTYSSSLVALKSDKATKATDLDKDGKIGIVSDRENIVGYQIPQTIIEENNIGNEFVEYDTYLDILMDLKDKKIAYAFLPTNYAASYQNMEELDWDKLEEETKILTTVDKKEENKTTNKNSKIDKPFTVLIMGVDSDKKDLANTAFNGDALMLMTFNPETLNTTMLSIPRDSYVPIACFKNQLKNKITHAAAYGESCMIDTIENFTGIDIDYYVKINFTGVVSIIDALGGVEVDVPYSFCEQNSKRQFGKHLIYVEEGKQTLNGEEALALARNRKSHSDICSAKWTGGIRNDFVRGQNQQLVLRAIMNKMKDVKSLNTIMNMLDKVSSSMATNMSTNEILSLYNVGKDIIVKSQNEKVEDLLGIQKLYLSGSDARIVDPRSGLSLYNYVLNQNSVDQVIEAMKVNLGKSKPTMIKKLSFDLDSKYEETVIGKNVASTTSSVSKLPSFIGMSEASARSKAVSLGISVSVNYVSSGSGADGTVIRQSYAAGYDMSYINSITFTVLKKKETTNNQTVSPNNTPKPAPTPSADNETPSTDNGEANSGGNSNNDTPDKSTDTSTTTPETPGPTEGEG